MQCFFWLFFVFFSSISWAGAFLGCSSGGASGAQAPFDPARATRFESKEPKVVVPEVPVTLRWGGVDVLSAAVASELKGGSEREKWLTTLAALQQFNSFPPGLLPLIASYGQHSPAFACNGQSQAMLSTGSEILMFGLTDLLMPYELIPDETKEFSKYLEHVHEKHRRFEAMGPQIASVMHRDAKMALPPIFHSLFGERNVLGMAYFGHGGLLILDDDRNVYHVDPYISETMPVGAKLISTPFFTSKSEALPAGDQIRHVRTVARSSTPSYFLVTEQGQLFRGERPHKDRPGAEPTCVYAPGSDGSKRVLDVAPMSFHSFDEKGPSFERVLVLCADQSLHLMAFTGADIGEGGVTKCINLGGPGSLRSVAVSSTSQESGCIGMRASSGVVMDMVDNTGGAWIYRNLVSGDFFTVEGMADDLQKTMVQIPGTGAGGLRVELLSSTWDFSVFQTEDGRVFFYDWRDGLVAPLAPLNPPSEFNVAGKKLLQIKTVKTSYVHSTWLEYEHSVYFVFDGGILLKFELARELGGDRKNLKGTWKQLVGPARTSAT
jgi:hypothetical protein